MIAEQLTTNKDRSTKNCRQISNVNKSTGL